ncbi:hypothetical protein [Mycobacterium sp.]|uniref:hypothetical protein n=1 Tax=Mycobacterium sp. TaxID=1785 RepID=UPI00333F341A
MREEIGKRAATGSLPEVVAEAVLRILTSKRPRTRYPSDGGAAMISPSARQAGQ